MTPNFQWRRSPVDKERGSRYVSGDNNNIPLGAPVVRTSVNGFGEAVVELAGADAPRPKPGAGGIANRDNLRFDSLETSTLLSSDYGYVAPGADLQVILAPNVKVAFRNTDALTMVAGASGATPTVQAGDYLTPAGDGTWKVTATEANGWLVVTSVANGWVEAEAYQA